MLSTATPQQEAEQSWGQDMALQQSKGGQEGSFALRTAILISAVAGNSCKLKPDPDASTCIPALTVGEHWGRGQETQLGLWGPISWAGAPAQTVFHGLRVQ